MDRAFPLGFPPSTAFYLTLYVLTLVAHVIFMNYVLAGTAYVAGRAVLSLRGGLKADPVDALLRDWLPFATGAAITAGVAPLLFLQILYREQFYTANLLLSHRWMAIVPVLIAGFYLLYLLKAQTGRTVSRTVGVGVALAAWACFAFTAFTWTENAMLSLDKASWTSMYSSGELFYRNAQIPFRLGIWVVGAFATLTAMIGWQIRAMGAEARSDAIVARGVAAMALMSLMGVTILGAVYALREPALAALCAKSISRPYFLVVIAGMAMEVVGWVTIWRRGAICRGPLMAASAGVLVAMLGATVLRECVRLKAIEVASQFPVHLSAASKGGFGVFLVCVVVNAILISVCIRVVMRSQRAD